MTLEMCGREEVWVQALQSPRNTWLAVSRPSSGNKQGQSANTTTVNTLPMKYFNTTHHNLAHQWFGKGSREDFFNTI